MRRLLPAILLVLLSTVPAFAADSRFMAFDVIIDPAQSELAAWQIEISYDRDSVSVVGIEGGDGSPFPADQPPQYDARGMTAGRIILAAFTTTRHTRTGPMRVARLHLRVIGSSRPTLTAKAMALADPSGRRIQAELQLKESKK